MIQRPIRLFALLGCLALTLLAACTSPPKTRVDKDSHVDFSTYKTFGWLDGTPPSGAPSDPRRMPSTLTTQRMHASIGTALQSKGYSERDADPDVRVSYVLNVDERPK